jgi:opacity protein-like surface antigen
MKSLLPLLVVAAAAQAQTATVKAPASNFSFTADKYEIARDVDDFDGMSYGIKAHVWDHVSLTLSYADVSSDPFELVSGLNMNLAASRYSVGAEYDIHSGPGALTLSLAFAETAARAQGGASGDAFKNQQFVIGARYAMALGEGFTATIAANKFISDFDPDKAFSTATNRAALATRFDGSPFSVGLTLAYAPTDNVSIHLTYATEDSLLGLAGADNTLSFGVRATF